MLTRMLVLCFSMVLTAPTMAAFKVETLDALEMETWRVRMGFHQLAVRGNAPEDINALKEIISEGEALIDSLAEQGEGEEASALVSQLTRQWAAFGKRALDNPLASVGYADFNAFSEINRLTLEIVRLVQGEKVASRRSENDDLFELGVRLLKISSEYIALATFPSAGINTGTSAQPMAFAEEAMKMEQQIAELEAAGTGGDAAQRMLETLKTRWAFIKGMIPVLDDPAAGRVPLLFYRYSSQTADDLLALSSS